MVEAGVRIGLPSDFLQAVGSVSGLRAEMAGVGTGGGVLRYEMFAEMTQPTAQPLRLIQPAGMDVRVDAHDGRVVDGFDDDAQAIGQPRDDRAGRLLRLVDDDNRAARQLRGSCVGRLGRGGGCLGHGWQRDKKNKGYKQR